MNFTFKILLVTTLLFIESAGFVQAQVIKFDVVLFGKKIGYTSVERVVKPNGTVEYKLRNKSEAKFGFYTKKSDINMTTVYRNGTLEQSSCAATNDEGLKTTFVNKTANGYDADINNKKFCIKKQIKNSSVLLYFFEPKSLTEIFSERLGVFFSLDKIAESEYMSVVNNVTSYYRYLNGKLVELEMSKPLGSVYLKLVQ